MLSDQKSYGQRLFWICLDLPSQQDGSLAYSPQGPDSLFLIFSHIVFFFLFGSSIHGNWQPVLRKWTF